MAPDYRSYLVAQGILKAAQQQAANDRYNQFLGSRVIQPGTGPVQNPVWQGITSGPVPPPVPVTPLPDRRVTPPIGGGVPQSAMSYPQLVSRGPAYGSQLNRPGLPSEPVPQPGMAPGNPGMPQPGIAGPLPNDVIQRLQYEQLQKNLQTMPGEIAAMPNPEPFGQLISDYVKNVRDAKGIDNTLAAATVEPIIKGVTSDTFKRGIDAVIPGNVQQAASFVNDQYQKPLNWSLDQTGQDVYKVATGRTQDTPLNPAYHIAGVELWANDPANKQAIQAIYENGLDINEDGKVDVTGGRAVMMYFYAKEHPGFFDQLISQMGMDPLFTVSVIAPAATAGRAGIDAASDIAAQTGRYADASGNLTRGARILRAADRTLALVEGAGDIGNKVADAPFSIPLWAGKKTAGVVSKTPMIGGKLIDAIRAPFGPGAESASRTGKNAARDVAEMVTGAPDLSGVNPLGGMPEPRPGMTALPPGATEMGPGGNPVPVDPLRQPATGYADVSTSPMPGPTEFTDPVTGMPVTLRPEDVLQRPVPPPVAPGQRGIPGGDVAPGDIPAMPGAVQLPPRPGTRGIGTGGDRPRQLNPDVGPAPIEPEVIPPPPPPPAPEIPEYDPVTGMPTNIRPDDIFQQPEATNPGTTPKEVPGGDVSIAEDMTAGAAAKRKTSVIGTKKTHTVQTIEPEPKPMETVAEVIPPDIAEATGDVPVRKSVTADGVVTDIGNGDSVRVVQRGDGVWEIQIKNGKGKWVGKMGMADESEAIAKAKAWETGSEVPPATTETTVTAKPKAKKAPPAKPKVEEAVAPDPSSPPPVVSTEVDAPAQGGSSGWSLSSKNHPNGMVAAAENQYPEQWARARENLAPAAAEYEAKMKAETAAVDPDLDLSGVRASDTIRRHQAYADRKMLKAEWLATIRDEMAKQGIPVGDLPNEPGTAVGIVNDIEKLVGDGLYSPNPEVAKAARNSLYDKGYMNQKGPREERYNEIRTASLTTNKSRPDGQLTFRGQVYTNTKLKSMTPYARSRLAEMVQADDALQFRRYKRFTAIREKLDQTRFTGAQPGELRLGSIPSPREAITAYANNAPYQAVTDKLYTKVLGEPVAPAVPKQPLRGTPFEQDYKTFQTDEINRLTQIGDIGEETRDYLRQVVIDDGEEIRTAWDVLSDIVTRRTKDFPGPITDKKGPLSADIRKWQKGVADEFAETMETLTGTKPPVKVRKTIADKVIGSITKKLGLLNRTYRENILFNWFTGPRGWAQDVISTNIKMIWEGHTGAINPTDYLHALKHEPDDLDLLLARTEMDLPDNLHIAGKFTDERSTERTGINEIVSGVFRREEGSLGDKIIQQVTAPLADVRLARVRQLSDDLARRGVFRDTVQIELPGRAREFRRMARKWADKYGIMPSSMDAYLFELGDQFGPSDVRRVVSELGHDAGLGGAAAAELTDMMATQWRKSINTIRNNAREEVNRVLFSYEKSNIDEQIGKFIFFHYWMSRSIPSYIRLGLHNPELAAMWFRAWDRTAQLAEEQGMPKTMVGFIRFQGNGITGFSNSYNPLQFFIPFDALRLDPYADTNWEKLSQFTAVSPVMQAMAAIAGWQSRAPDMLGLYATRNGANAFLNEMRAHGWIGDISLPNDWYDTATNNAFEWANKHAAEKAHWFKDVAFVDQKLRNGEAIDYIMRDIIEEQTGVPYDQTNPKWQPGGEYFETWAEAKQDFTSGSDNPIAAKAYREWADAGVDRTKWNFITPGGVRMDYAPRTDALAASQAGDTNEQAFARWSRAGSPEDFALDEMGAKYQQIGTPRQQSLSQYWSDVVYNVGDRKFDGQVLWISDKEFIRVEDLRKMDVDQRKEIANHWIASLDGTDDLKAYRDEQKKFEAANPEYGDYEHWKSWLGSYDGGVRVAREDRAKGNPNFKRAMQEQEASLRKRGIDEKLIPAELDSWAFSMAAYKAAQGIQDSIYDSPPKSTGDQATVDTIRKSSGGGSGGGSSKGAPKTIAQKVTADLATYEQEARMFDEILRGVGVTGGMDAINNPLMRGALESQFGDLMPTKGKLLTQYLAWRDMVIAQNPNADASPEAFQEVMNRLQLDEAA